MTIELLVRLRRGGVAVILVGALLFSSPVLGDDRSPGADARQYGAPLSELEPTPLGEVLENADALDGKRIALRGRIADVCQKKGCWTILQDGEATIRVRFENYGFFLPTDSQGQIAVAEGQLQIRTLSEREARHYASESAESDPASVGAIDGPQREVGFIASGVRIETR